jgi:hypothetical protein
MYKQKGVGKSREEARRRAEEALKERLWRECWKDEIELQGVSEMGRERENGEFEVTLEI